MLALCHPPCKAYISIMHEKSIKELTISTNILYTTKVSAVQDL